MKASERIQNLEKALRHADLDVEEQCECCVELRAIAADVQKLEDWVASLQRDTSHADSAVARQAKREAFERARVLYREWPDPAELFGQTDFEMAIEVELEALDIAGRVHAQAAEVEAIP